MTPHDHPNHGDHHHSHSHAHGHSHGHHHHSDTEIGLRWALFLNLGFALLQLFGGWWSNSVSVLSSAFHDFGDAGALLAALLLERWARRHADTTYSYGYRRWSLLSALLMGALLMGGSVWIWIESWGRWSAPEEVRSDLMLVFAILGVGVNGYSWWRLSKGSALNDQMLRIHFIEDLAGWVGLLLVAGVLWATEWWWLDPLLAVALSLWVAWNVGKRVVQVFGVLLQGTPSSASVGDVEAWMRSQPGVKSVHHTHLWSLDGTQHILTTHVVVSGELPVHQVKALLKRGLKEKYQIVEATLETEEASDVCLDPSH